MATTPPTPPGGGAPPKAKPAVTKAAPAPPKPEIGLHITGNRKKLRVRITHYLAGSGQMHLFPLCFGPPSDPCGFSVADPTGGNYQVQVTSGSGVKDDIDLSAYPQFTKVGIVKPNGEELSADIPNDDPILTTATPTPTAVKATQIEVVITSIVPDDPKHTTYFDYYITVFTRDDSGNPVDAQIRTAVVGCTGTTTHNTAGGSFDETTPIRVNQDNKDLKYKATLPNGKSDEKPLPAPPKQSTDFHKGTYLENVRRWKRQ